MNVADDVRLSKNFMASEFWCKCGCDDFEISSNLIEGLQELRDILGKPVFVNSGFRCKKHNQEIGGSPKSQHLFGAAADIISPGRIPLEIAEIAKSIEVFRNGGIGLYTKKGFVHLDVRGYPSRWKD